MCVFHFYISKKDQSLNKFSRCVYAFVFKGECTCSCHLMICNLSHLQQNPLHLYYGTLIFLSKKLKKALMNGHRFEPSHSLSINTLNGFAGGSFGKTLTY